jgi:hypothetical protein
MEELRNPGGGRLATAAIIGVGVLSALPGTLEFFATNADSASAEKNIPARTAEPFDIGATVTPWAVEQHQDRTPTVSAARFVIGRCGSTDSLSPNPQWHVRSGFETNGKPVYSTKPGAVEKFVSHVSGGNVDSWNEEVDIYRMTKDMKVLQGGSQPAWSKAGGAPHWVLKDLCHWNKKEKVSFFVKISDSAKVGSLCLAYDVWGRTGSNIQPLGPPIQRSCLKVK